MRRCLLLGGAVVVVLGFLALPVARASASACPNEALRSELRSGQLPECRAYELVSPIYKEGTVVSTALAVSPDGSRFIAGSIGIFGGAGEGEFLGNGSLQAVAYEFSRIEPSGWRVSSLAPPGSIYSSKGMVDASADLGSSLWELGTLQPAQPEGVTDFYLERPQGTFTEVGPPAPSALHPGDALSYYDYLGASADLSHVLFSVERGFRWPFDKTVSAGNTLYEYVGADQQEPSLVGVSGGRGSEELVSQCGTRLGSSGSEERVAGEQGGAAGSLYNAISASGARIFFTAVGKDEVRAGEPACDGEAPLIDELFAREEVEPEGFATTAVSEPSIAYCSAAPSPPCADANFEGASQDGSKVFFTSTQKLPGVEGASEDENSADSAVKSCSLTTGPGGCNLYEYEFEPGGAHRLLLVSGGSSEPEGARVQGVARISEDGSHVYFVAKGVLTDAPNSVGSRAVSGADNLYVHDTLTGETMFVGELCSGKEESGSVHGVAQCPGSGGDGSDWAHADNRPVMASQDGQFLVFASVADLTDEGLIGGKSQVFQYDAATGGLVRASIGQGGYNDDDRAPVAGSTIVGRFPAAPPYVTADSPAIAAGTLAPEDGAVFFESPDALTLHALADQPDLLGQAVPNVYEYRDGSVYLLSDGHDTSVVNGAPGTSLIGSDPSGDDVFFFTDDSLIPEDGDTQQDIYDARVDGGFPTPSAPLGCTEEACDGPLSATPALPGARRERDPGRRRKSAARRCTGEVQGQAEAETEGQEEGESQEEGEGQGRSSREQGGAVRPDSWERCTMTTKLKRIGAHFAESLLATTLVLLAAPLSFGSSAVAAPAGPGWSIRSLAQPTDFSSVNDARCETGAGGAQVCDSYSLVVTNVGSAEAAPGTTITDTLPLGVRALAIEGFDLTKSSSVPDLVCSKIPLRCVDEGGVSAGDTLLVQIQVSVVSKIEEMGVLSVPNSASASGGGAPAVVTEEQTAINPNPAPFRIEDFSLQPFDRAGAPDIQAGGHPYALLTSLDFSSENREVLGGKIIYRPPEEVKDVIVDLPPGFVGDPQALPKCPLYALIEGNDETSCPRESRIGEVVFEASPGAFRASESLEGSQTSAVYNMVPEPGFPAEFGFTYLGKMVIMYASSVRIGSSYRLRVTVPGIPNLQTIGVSLLFFGDPAEEDGGSHSSTPFFTNPVDCSAGSLSATVEVDTWEHPDEYQTREAVSYPQVTGCNMLQFQPTLSVAPETTRSDEPSGYTFEVANPQYESAFTPGTPELRDATVTLPAGVSVSPSAADGLRACAASGPEGINLGSEDTGVAGEDLGDPEATELGEGHGGPGGNSSPYDDGLSHTAPGHCPAASTIGTVEISTPLLTSPLEGHVYLAQPGCGGTGQAPCSEADAANGTLFGIYVEAAGSGAVLKLAGSTSVNPSTGQITASFQENPQLPFSAFKLHFDGGPRAALANPQACGPATTIGDLSAWSSPTTPDVVASPFFDVDWDGAGGACPATLPLTPSLVAETTNPTAGAFSPFTLTIARADRQQYLSQLSVTTPPGLLGMLSSVPLCREPQAAQGTCPAASEIGTTTVAAGAGSHPFWITGRVYLTESYRGAPFGLSVVVPAVAGPFDLGVVVVRSAITVDPNTSALTITTDPLPQIIDGVPLRIQTVNVSVNRPDFMFNPTGCHTQQIAVTVAGAQGALAHVSNPFTAANCRALPFSPKLTVASQARTSKSNGASLLAKVTYKPGQANIKSVAVVLPKQLPARLTTIQQACLAATFEANPAACPAGSLIGIAKATTPVLPVPVSGPMYLVSHGGAAFPDLVLLLQGDGVRVDQTASIYISKSGVTSSTFANIPDVPLSSVELSFPEGPHSALAATLPASAKGSLCNTALVMPTTITGQNGAQIKQSTKITVTGCPKAKKARKAKTRAKRAAAAGLRAGHEGGR